MLKRLQMNAAAFAKKCLSVCVFEDGIEMNKYKL